ncbi:putative DNA topoisomerase [Cricetibacter osteomyelitidis]|uniref:Putative DNA topoisomerase n=1 Tax=Cricetibacter osteomyelitidis TaxID=1521931 RepID=A0A4V2T1U5_9PAST|nr:type I DNA topoisomerase [Cricetibacter osteomyelitidis]TCP94913.1 putative DNA topoisomerase [Cricetibacter osteomyelitidis]
MNQSLFTPSKQQEHCPQCGSPLQLKQGKKGLFLGCSAYPDCDYLKPLHSHSEHKIIKELTESCPECGEHLQLKQGSFGMFIGCSGYPACHFIVHEQAESETPQYPCPECGKGHLIARKGRQGKTFYGCDNYPKCKFTLSNEPHLITCPQCGGELCTIKKQSEQYITWQCAKRACRHLFTVEK